jgi:hypothetical protein
MATFFSDAPACPICRSMDIYPHSDPSGMEWLLQKLAKICPFQCTACRRSFYLFRNAVDQYMRDSREHNRKVFEADSHE